MENEGRIPNGLDKVIIQNLKLVDCPVEKCEVRGDYWKCYMGNYLNCGIYVNSLPKKKYDNKEK